MKKKIISAILFIALLAAIAGVAILTFTIFNMLGSVTDTTKSAVTPLVIIIGVLIVLWLVLFIFLEHYRKTGSIFGERKTDRLTGLGGKKTLRSNFEYATSNHLYSCLAYIAFDTEKLKSKYDEKLCDSLQKGAAKIIKGSCGEKDCASRLEDGVFSIFLYCQDGVQAHDRINDLTEQLNKYERQVLLDDVAPFSAGIFLPEVEKISFDNAFENARIGYKYAKDNNVQTLICTKDLLVQEASKGRIRESLSRAIDNNEFELHLQFIYETRKDNFVGAEVLSRWNNPTEGMIMPGGYINDMRTTGIIERFDMYMLDKTCEQLAKWSAGEFSHLTLSCNITRITIASEEFVRNFRKILKKYNFNHNLLILEITEDALIDNQTVANRNIVACKEDGVRVAIDDFGSGHSSLHDLSDYPVDYIKIDRKIIAKTESDRGDALLSGIINLAHSLHMEAVCEGVETKKQMEIAKRCDCDFIQGYYFSYVFSVEESENLYRKSLEKTAAAD